ncbi:MAG: hypothetical protein HYY36_01455 [Gammaproteobacteria bacterium]|nr:hypothetical protein [Gammaproteobacteria bacterium]
MRQTLISSLMLLIMYGCAGSASHKVLTSYEQNDVNLDCAEIDTEIAKAQDVIDAVNQDKEDISGKDVIDGLLWFPFNLIAKSSNYDKALEAADGRMERLTELKNEKGCSH